MKRYKVIFNSKVISEYNVETVKKNLASILKGDEKKIERLFSGQPILIKKDTDYQTAYKYMNAFKKAGAICKVEAIEMPSSAEPPDATYVDKSSAYGKKGSMTCPKCGHKQVLSSKCTRCGLVIKKMQVTTIKKFTVRTEPEDRDQPGERGSLEFRSNRFTTIVAGTVAGFIGICNLLMFAAFADQGAPWFLNLLGALLILISIAFITYKKTVRLDGLKRSVEKKANALFWKKIELYNFSDFKGVGISTAGRTIARRPQISYFVQLLGLRNLSIPGYSPDKDEVLSKARNIAQFLNLPLDEKSKIGFFGKRL